MNNIFYFRKINAIGGTEQFLYEIAKKYKDWDITIYFDEADKKQLERLRKLVRCRKRKKGEIVKCDRAFFNFNIDMIDEVDAKEYYFVSHANWEELGYRPPIQHPKLTKFVGVSDFSVRKLEEIGKLQGLDIKAIKTYNPLTLEKVQDVKILVSACRLDDAVKGGARTIRLIQALDEYCEKNNRNYLWMIFTNHTGYKLESPNVAFMKPRVDVRPYIAMADWALQLSNDMETYCYTINEALGYGTPVVTTPLTIMDELPVTENERITLRWDCSNVDEVAKQIFEKKVKPFKYEIPNDSWDKILKKGKSNYHDESQEIVKARVKFIYTDLQLNRLTKENEIIEVKRERAEQLEELNLVEILE